MASVWSPVGDGDQGTIGEKSPESTPSEPPPASAVASAAPSAVATSSAVAATAAMSVTGTQAGLAHWMSVVAEHMNSADTSSNAGANAHAGQLHQYAWQNSIEVGSNVENLVVLADSIGRAKRALANH